MKRIQTGLQGEDTAAAPAAAPRALYMSFELGDKTWKLTLSDARRSPSCFTVAAGDQAAVLVCIAKAKTRAALAGETPVYSCYEAGRDGWGCTAGCTNTGYTTSWSTLRASKCTAVHAVPRPIGSTARSC